MKIADGKKRDQVRGRYKEAVVIDDATTHVWVGDQHVGDVGNFTIVQKEYDVCWHETYEVSARVQASCLEEALAKASKIRNTSPKLTEPGKWNPDEEGDEDFAFEACCEEECDCSDADEKVMAEFIQAGRIECLPTADDEEDEG